jgi:hypothetical protein
MFIVKTPTPFAANTARATTGTYSFFDRLLIVQEVRAERDEIDRLKWIESEKVGYDIGFENALRIWQRHHRDLWRAARDRERAGNRAHAGTGNTQQQH